MLSRWEEWAHPDKDDHGRFTGAQSLAGKCQFLSSPVVNEYVEILWALLRNLGVKQSTKGRRGSHLSMERAAKSR